MQQQTEDIQEDTSRISLQVQGSPVCGLLRPFERHP
jgi:hypothetical protein